MISQVEHISATATGAAGNTSSGNKAQTTTTTTITTNGDSVEDPDFPAESFLLPIEDELDWVDRNAAAAAFDREDSTKGTTNPKSHAKPQQPPQQASNSQRFSGNLKSLGVQNAAGRKVCRNGNFFPKKRSDVSAAASEPISPKVSCIGRVRSKSSEQNSSAGGLWSCCRGTDVVV